MTLMSRSESNMRFYAGFRYDIHVAALRNVCDRIRPIGQTPGWEIGRGIHAGNIFRGYIGPFAYGWDAMATAPGNF